MAKPELRDHRKFLKLKRLLGDPVPHLIGYLECLWIRGYQTGSPIIGDELDVEAAAEYPGEEGRFAKAAVASGFVDVDENGIHRIHDLFQHAPKYVQLRMVRKKTAPEGSSWESVTGKKKRPKNENGSTNELENGKNEFGRTAKRRKTAKANPKAENLETRSENQEPKAESQEPRTKNQEPKASSVSSGDADAPLEKEEPKPRPRDLLFDAIAEVAGADPKINGSQIAGVKKALTQADPPYGPDDVFRFGKGFLIHCPWAQKDGRMRPTISEIQKYISLIRASPPRADPAVVPKRDGGLFMTRQKSEDAYFAKQVESVLAGSSATGPGGPQ